MSFTLPRLLLAAALFPVCASPAADETAIFEPHYSLKVYETDDGLPHNAVASVIQRTDGYLWAATNGGLVRFDGTQFTAIPLPSFTGRQSSSVRAMILENPKNLLLANASLVIRVAGDHLFLPQPVVADFRPDQNLKFLFREKDDVFWIMFSNREAWRCAGDKIEKFPPPAKRSGSDAAPTLARDSDGNVFLARGLGVERYQAGRLVPLAALAASPALVCPSRRGGIWIATASQLFHFDQNDLTAMPSPPSWLEPAQLTAILEDSQGAVWISATGQGIKRWTPNGSIVLAPSHPLVRNLLEDNEGNVWAATAGGGLDCFRPARCELVAPAADWATDAGGSVCEDGAGDIWFVNRHGVRKIHGSTIVQLRPEDGWPKGALPVSADAAGNVWLAVGPRICIARAGGGPPVWLDSKSPGNIRSIYTSRTGDVWIGRERGPLERYRNFVREEFGPDRGFPDRKISSIGEDAAGHLWFGSDAGELFEWINGRFISFGKKDGLPEKEIRVIHGDAEGDLWIGTADGLIVRQQDQFFRLSEAQGLISHVISQILEDDAGTLWFCTPQGLFRVEKAALLDCIAGRRSAVTPVIYGRSDGLSGISAIGSYQPTAWKTRSGRLWFATRKGLITIDPAGHSVDHDGPPVYLERFLVDGRVLEPGFSRISSAVKRLEFKFTAPTFRSPEDVRFRYRLRGLDSDWSEPTTQRTAVYPALRPGRYKFEVTACNSDLVWNPVAAALAFEVVPMWWETWWARIAAALAGGMALIMSVRYWSHRRLKARLLLLQQKQRVEQERTRIARDLHDGLGANITQVGMMAEALSVDCASYDEMKALSAKLAEQVRTIARDLDTTVWAVSPKNDSLRSLCAYLCQFSLDYFNHSPVRCRVHAAEDIPAISLSPETRHHLFMIARELMNNVLKHAHASQAGLTMRMEGDCFVLGLSDNGCGFSPEAAASSGRSGLRNLHLRAEEIGGVLDVQSSPQGTTVTLNVRVDRAARALPARPRPAG